MSFDRLQEKIDRLQNPTVVGLDPAFDLIPPHLIQKYIQEKGETLDAVAEAILEFSIGIINALFDIVPAIKPQSAFYEALGPVGVGVLKLVINFAKDKGMYVILDAKRNDIGSTAEAYSTAYLGAIKIGDKLFFPFDADALTVNAYLGTDGVKPFINNAKVYDKALFALVKTSNPSSGELQDKIIDGKPLYAIVGELMESISKDTIGAYGYSRVGAVVGATYPDELRYLRNNLKNTFFLVPGYGAQGGSAVAVASAFDDKGRGVVINSSRGIISAWKNTSDLYTVAARNEALKMRDQLRKVCYN